MLEFQDHIHGQRDGQQDDEECAQAQAPAGQHLELGVEQVTQQHPAAGPQDGADPVAELEHQRTHPAGAGERRGDEAQAGQEFGHRQRPRPQPVKRAQGAPHAGVRFQRDPAEQPDHGMAPPAPQQVPAGVGDHRSGEGRGQRSRE